MSQRAVLSCAGTVFIASMLIAGCGGGGAQSLGIQVGIASPRGPQTVEAGQTVNITASVSSAAPSTNLGVTWTLSGSGCTGATCGSLTNETSTSVTYTAPASVPSSFTVNLTATSMADSTKSASLQIAVAAISVTINSKVTELAAGSGNGFEKEFNATVQDDPAGKGVTWALTANGSPCSPTCGTLSMGNASFVFYIPPSTVPASPADMPTITATSISDATKSDADQFTIFDGSAACGTGGHESVLNGEYAILLQGWSGGGTGTPVMFAASFKADGTGKITFGQDQFNPYSTYAYTGNLIPSASSYSVGADNRGGLTLTDNFCDRTFTFHFSLGGITGGLASKGDIILTGADFAGGLRGSGILRQQDPTAFSVNSLAANYAFGFSGWDQSSGSLQHFAVVGSFAQSGGSLYNLDAHSNDGGTLLLTGGQSPGNFSTISNIATGTGSTTVTLDLPEENQTTQQAVVYVINSSELFVVSMTLGNEGAEFCGVAIAAPGSFDSSSISPSYIFHFTGNSAGSASVAVGVANFSGGTDGNVSGTFDQYASGMASSQSLSGTYGLAQSGGRLKVTGASGAMSPVCYLDTPFDNVSAFCLTTDSSASFGVLDDQPAATYGNSSLSGNFVFGTSEPGDNTVPGIAGVASISAGGVSGTEDTAAPSGPTLGTSFSGSLTTNADGTGTLGANTVTVTNGTVLYYIDEANDAPAQVQVFEP